MSDWQLILDIKEAWEKSNNKEIEISELANIISQKLIIFKIPSNWLNYDDVIFELEEIISEFDDIANYSDIDSFEDSQFCFNENMKRLYDWADKPLDNKFGGKKICWVKTF